MPKTLRPVQPVAVTGPEVLDQDMTARDICDTLKRLRFRNGPQVIALGDKEASISPSRDPTGAMNGRRFPPPWPVEEQLAARHGSVPLAVVLNYSHGERELYRSVEE